MLVESWAIERLIPNPLNPRGLVGPEDEGIAELADSIIHQGLLQPLIITPEGLIVAGHRRHAACLAASVTHIAVSIKQLSEAEQLQIMLVENMQRAGLNALQIARAYKQLLDSGMTLQSIAAKVGYAVPSVRKHLGILQLAEPLWDAFSNFKLSLGHVPALLEIKDQKLQIETGFKAIEKDWMINELWCEVHRIQRGGELPVYIEDEPEEPKEVPHRKPEISKPSLLALLDDNNPTRKRLNYAWDKLELARERLLKVTGMSHCDELLVVVQTDIVEALETLGKEDGRKRQHA